MKKENILQALNYLIDSEHSHYLELLSSDDTSAENHIYMIAVSAKHDLLECIA